MARFEPVDSEKLPPEQKSLYEAVRAGRPKLVGPFSVLMHNPPLAKAVKHVALVLQAVPFTIPRAAYAMAGLFLVASSLFALRYGFERKLDLRQPLAALATSMPWA